MLCVTSLRKLGRQIPSDLVHCGLREYQANEAKLAENQDRVAGASAGKQAGNEDVSVDTNEERLSLLGRGHLGPSTTAFALDAGVPSRRRAVARRAPED
jgi:hypothetical protein